VIAGATIAMLGACKSGDYDGSFDGSIDGGPSAEGSTASRMVQPDKTETVASADGVIDVTFGAGTFATAATITITSAGEQTLDTGLIVPIYVVSADKVPAKFFQVSLHGNGNANGVGPERALVPAQESAGTYKPLLMTGAPTTGGGSSSSFWGLTKTFGTFSLTYVTNIQVSSFPEISTSCTGQCCPAMNNNQVSGFSNGCFCPTSPNLDCFLQHCTDLEAPAARCAALATANSTGSVECKPFNANCQTGGGCAGYAGFCGNGGSGGPNNFNACCVVKGGGTCAPSVCAGFAARCTKDTACPPDSQCCVFESESYCAKDCPAAQRACATNADCTDAGPDAGTCQGGRCPVGVCGIPPEACR
jgi:hypothetical protein